MFETRIDITLEKERNFRPTPLRWTPFSRRSSKKYKGRKFQSRTWKNRREKGGIRLNKPRGKLPDRKAGEKKVWDQRNDGYGDKLVGLRSLSYSFFLIFLWVINDRKRKIPVLCVKNSRIYTASMKLQNFVWGFVGVYNFVSYFEFHFNTNIYLRVNVYIA